MSAVKAFQFPPKTILVPTDFSEPSIAALDYAVDLAEKVGATVHVIHAYELPLIGAPEASLMMSTDMLKGILDAAEKALAELAGKYAARKINLVTALEQSDPRDAVVAASRRVDADLIIMGTHGRRGLARALIGSVAETVVRTSTVPVLTIRMGTVAH